MDGALTVPPRVQAVPPVRNTSASSMQSPPAMAEATRVSWNAVESTTAYRVGYKVPTDTIWTELSDVTATSTEETLSCGFYDFRVRAKGDAGSYGGRWGFWSEPVGSVDILDGTCTRQGRSAPQRGEGGRDHAASRTTYEESATSTPHAESPPPAPLGLSATSTASSVTLTWRAPADSTVTGYRILRKKLGQPTWRYTSRTPRAPGRAMWTRSTWRLTPPTSTE